MPFSGIEMAEYSHEARASTASGVKSSLNHVASPFAETEARRLMPALLPSAAPIHEAARLRILEAYIEALKAEDESLKRSSPTPRSGRREKSRRRKERSLSFRPSRDGSRRGRPSGPWLTTLAAAARLSGTLHAAHGAGSAARRARRARR
jgi:hypothetical protein